MSDSWWIGTTREELNRRAAEYKFHHVRLKSETRGVIEEFRAAMREELGQRGRKILAARRAIGFDTPKVTLITDHDQAVALEPAITSRAAALSLVRDAINMRYRLGFLDLWIQYNDSIRFGLGAKLEAAARLLAYRPFRQLPEISNVEWARFESFIATHRDQLDHK